LSLKNAIIACQENTFKFDKKYTIEH